MLQLPIAEHAVNVALVVNADEESARTPVDGAELLARQADGRRVHDRHHLLHILRQDPIKQAFVTILLFVCFPKIKSN